MTLTLRQGIGYAGKLGQRAYVAEITGSDEEYGLARAFLDADRVERDKFNSARYVRTYTYSLGRGLYEVQSEGERRVGMVHDGTFVRLDPERVRAMVALLDDGMDFDAARAATEAPVAAAS